MPPAAHLGKDSGAVEPMPAVAGSSSTYPDSTLQHESAASRGTSSGAAVPGPQPAKAAHAGIRGHFGGHFVEGSAGSSSSSTSDDNDYSEAFKYMGEGPARRTEEGLPEVPQSPDDRAEAQRLCSFHLKEEAFRVEGPFLQFLGYDPGSQIWRGTALFVFPPSISEAPRLSISDAKGKRTLKGQLLDTIDDWRFWRFDLEVRAVEKEQEVTYNLLQSDNANRSGNSFFVPGKEQTWHWGFNSCNGLSSDADPEMWGDGKTAPPLWKDVVTRHKAAPLHVMVGGGDQLYCDGVWSTDRMLAWLGLEGTRSDKAAAAFTPEMESDVHRWYFNHYREHWNTDGMRQAFASIAQVMTWDDHDIFDGWGSYPPKLHDCPVFQGVYLAARRFYLLFQQHSTPSTIYKQNDVFGQEGTYSMIRMMGPTVALFLPDARAERSMKRVISKESYDLMFDKLAHLPSSVKHVVAVLTVPIVFPSLPASRVVEHMLDAGWLRKTLQSTGLAVHFLDKFGHASLLDDIVDHWDAAEHVREREELIERFQDLSKQKDVRVSFISGDVHVCGVGRLYTHPKVRNLQSDHRFMTQITSSAIWNAPPPKALISLLHRFNHAHKAGVHRTKEKMLRIFKPDFPASPKLQGRRNWCEVEQHKTVQTWRPHWPGSKESARRQKGVMIFTLRLEKGEGTTPVDEEGNVEVDTYSVIVPTYSPSKAGKLLSPRHWKKRFRWCGVKADSDQVKEI